MILLKNHYVLLGFAHFIWKYIFYILSDLFGCLHIFWYFSGCDISTPNFWVNFRSMRMNSVLNRVVWVRFNLVDIEDWSIGLLGSMQYHLQHFSQLRRDNILRSKVTTVLTDCWNIACGVEFSPMLLFIIGVFLILCMSLTNIFIFLRSRGYVYTKFWYIFLP